MFVIQRTARGEPVTYWGRMEGWVVRPPLLRFSQVLSSGVPSAAMRYERWEVAQDVAESLRMQNLEHGVVIAVFSEQEQATV